MKPHYERDGVRLYLGDAADILPRLERFDAIVCDPPFGIGEAAGKNKSRSKLAVAQDFGDDAWDDQPVSQELIQQMLGMSKYQCIFGGNYYALPPTSCWLVWDKLNFESDFADCELCWTNLKKAVRRLQLRSAGMIRDWNEPRIHPCQKPIEVMRWVLSHLPKDVVTVCDPFMGVASTGLACIRNGLRFVGVERETKYFQMACDRINAEFARTPLFDAIPVQQTCLFEESA